MIRIKPLEISAAMSAALARVREDQAKATSEPPSTFAMYSRKRKAAIKRATPKWADRKAIERIYAKARATSRRTGIRHHVDHLVQIQGLLVCGLHVECNLRIIPSRDNSRKKNTWRPAAWEIGQTW